MENGIKVGFPLGIFVLGVGVWYLWSNQGKTHNVTDMSGAFAEDGYDPYVWWRAHSNGAAWIHHYPAEIKVCHYPDSFENEIGTLSTTMNEGEEIYRG